MARAWFAAFMVLHFANPLHLPQTSDHLKNTERDIEIHRKCKFQDMEPRLPNDMASHELPCNEGTQLGQPLDQEIKSAKKEPQLCYSPTPGFPPFVLDPDDLLPCPDTTGAVVQRIDDDTVVKFGHDVSLSEAAAMVIVARNTSVPVPSVKSAYILDGVGYIVMSFEEGISLATHWPLAAPDQRQHVITQLRDYFSQIRTIKEDYIGGADHMPCMDGFFRQYWEDPNHSYGPYESEQEFNEGLVQTLVDRIPPARRGLRGPLAVNDDLVQSIRALHGHEAVLTHGDLNPGNIIIRPDGKVVLIDWGTSGFYPEYWEYCRARMNPCLEDWVEQIENFLQPCEEYVVMRKLFYVSIN